MSEITSKVCAKCNLDLPIYNFYFRKDSGKHRENCKICVKGQVKSNSILTSDKIKKRQKAFREANKEKIAVKNKEWRVRNTEYIKNYVKDNPDIIKPIRKRTYEKHKEKINLNKKQWYQNNKKRHAENRTNYELKNKDRLLAARRIWEKERMKNDLNYLLRKTLRGRIRESLKNGVGKKERTEELVGCDLDYFRAYIEKQFTEGMSWDNWSLRGWHLDHKIPISWFNLESEPCRKAAFNYMNMQPLWASDNILKNNKFHTRIEIDLCLKP